MDDVSDNGLLKTICRVSEGCVRVSMVVVCTAMITDKLLSRLSTAATKLFLTCGNQHIKLKLLPELLVFAISMREFKKLLGKKHKQFSMNVHLQFML